MEHENVDLFDENYLKGYEYETLMNAIIGMTEIADAHLGNDCRRFR